MRSYYVRMTLRIPIFTPGEHTAMNGVSRAYPAELLQDGANAYDPTTFHAPVVLGHPEHNHPAWGWVDSLQFVDGVLWAVIGDLDADFAKWVREKRYKKVSASFYLPDSPANPKPGTLYLRHVGFLGAAAPSLKHLPEVALPVELAEAEGVEVFESENLTQCEQEVIHHADQSKENTVTQEEIDALQARINSLEAENQSLKSDIATHQEETRAAQTALVEHQRQARHADHAAFCEQMIAQGRLLPANKLAAVATLDYIAAQDAPMEFGEGDEKALLTVEAFKQLLSSVPVQVPFGEVTADNRERTAVRPQIGVPDGYEVDPKAAALHAQVLAYVEAHPETSYVMAAEIVAGHQRH